MATTHHLTYAVAYMALLRVIPRETEVPDHYWTAVYARQAFKNKAIIDSIPAEPSGLTDVSWPFRKVFGEFTRVFDHAVDGPLITLAINFERWMRGDVQSAVQMAEKNLEALKAQNAAYDDELKRLAPINERISKLVELAMSLQKGFSLDNDVVEAATIIAKYVEKTLTDPKFMERLKTTEERIERISTQLDAAVEKLETAKKAYEEKLKILSDLMEEYHQLGGECSEQVKLIQSHAEQFLQEYQTQVKHVATTLFVN